MFFVPLFFGISIIVFCIMNAAGNPVMLMISERPGVSEETVQHLTVYYGLDKPIYQQYLLWMWRFLHWDLGDSFWMAAPVNALIESWFFETMKLQLIAISIALALGVVIGVKSAVKQYSKTDMAATTISLFGISMPGFWTGLMLITFFSLTLGWFPSYGAHSTGTPIYGNVLLDDLWHLVLPASVLTYWYLAFFVRLTRTSMLEVLRQDYVLAARAGGLPMRTVTYKHALRNALIPVVTYLGWFLAIAVGNAPVTETVFSWPGMGYLYVRSIALLDFPVLMAINMVVTLMVLVLNLLTDVAYGIIDPTIKFM